jgi:Zn-dependent protease
VNLVSVILAGIALRVGLLPGEAQVFAIMFAFTNSSLFVFHLLPIPGLDGARMVALALAPSVRETYRHLDQYLPLVVIAVLILFSGSAFGILGGLARAVCRAASGLTCL